MVNIIKLSDESTGECPCGCGRDAYPYATETAGSGYVDAAPECALAHLVSAGLLDARAEVVRS